MNVEQARELIERASGRDWRVQRVERGEWAGKDCIVGTEDRKPYDGEQTYFVVAPKVGLVHCDAEFIAAARTGWPEALERAEAAEREAGELRERNETLTEALREAIDAIDEWGAYASDYFQEKWDLAGQITKLRGVLDARAALSTGEDQT